MNNQRMKEFGVHIARLCLAVPSTFVITDDERDELCGMDVKSWYLACFPTDDLGKQIPDGYTFKGLFYLLNRRKYSYQLFANDSIVRERIFSGLAYAMDVPYSEVYEQWLLCKNLDSPIFGDIEGDNKSLNMVFEIMSNY